jgi:hypothetical protein
VLGRVDLLRDCCFFGSDGITAASLTAQIYSPKFIEIH